jgi:hypothetical protein
MGNSLLLSVEIYFKSSEEVRKVTAKAKKFAYKKSMTACLISIKESHSHDAHYGKDFF